MFRIYVPRASHAHKSDRLSPHPHLSPLAKPDSEAPSGRTKACPSSRLSAADGLHIGAHREGAKVCFVRPFPSSTHYMRHSLSTNYPSLSKSFLYTAHSLLRTSTTTTITQRDARATTTTHFFLEPRPQQSPSSIPTITRGPKKHLKRLSHPYHGCWTN